MLNRQQKISLTVLVALVASSLSATTVFATPKVAGRFQSILAELQQTTEVPLVIPSQLPTEDYAIVPARLGDESSSNKKEQIPTLYPHIIKANASQYNISLDVDPECEGGGYCDRGIVTGEKITGDTPDIPRHFTDLVQLYRTDPNFQKPPLMRSPEKPARVQLAGGITGYFFPFSCGANCGNSKVVWDQNGYRYSVGLEMGSKQTVINMANSAIRNQK